MCGLIVVPAAQAGPLTIDGASSWFSGSCDGADNGITASGIPASIPGIALPRRDTFGDWFVVLDHSSGRRALAVHSDYGPAGSTGRVIDLTYSLVARFQVYGAGPCFYNFPNGRVTATKIVADLHYPSCGWAARQATIELRKRAGPLGAPGTCLYGKLARKLRSFQFRIHHPHNARAGVVDLGTWRALYRAR